MLAKTFEIFRLRWYVHCGGRNNGAFKALTEPFVSTSRHAAVRRVLVHRFKPKFEGLSVEAVVKIFFLRVQLVRVSPFAFAM
jgi:hypothetical protein